MQTHNHFTAEEVEYILAHYAEAKSAQDLADIMNSHFGTNRSAENIREKCRKSALGVSINNPTRYGQKPKEQLPIGTIRTVTNGATYVKVKDVPVGAKFTGYARPYWIPLQEKLYADVYGELPKGMMVCFLNCDRSDFRIENLYPISRKIAARMAQNQWWSDNPIITMTGIKWCELFLETRGDRR